MANDDLVFVCIQCGHGCASYEDLTSHIEDHEDQKPDIRQLRKSTLESKNKGVGKYVKNKKANNVADDVSWIFLFPVVEKIFAFA